MISGQALLGTVHRVVPFTRHIRGIIQANLAAADAATAQAGLEQIRASQTSIVAATQYAATAYAAQLTQQAETTATERAWLAQGWTATADASNATSTAQVGQAILAAQFTQTQQVVNMVGTQTAATATAAQGALDRQSTLDAANVIAAATGVAAQAAQAAAAAERTRITNQFMAWFRYWIWPLLLVVLVIIAYWGYLTWTRNRIIARDPRGAAPVVILNGKLTNPDLMMYPQLDSPNVPPDLQATHAANVQKVSAVRALPNGEQHTARRMIKHMANSNAPTPQPGYRILPQGDPLAGRFLDATDTDALDAQWEEVDDE